MGSVPGRRVRRVKQSDQRNAKKKQNEKRIYAGIWKVRFPINQEEIEIREQMFSAISDESHVEVKDVHSGFLEGQARQHHAEGTKLAVGTENSMIIQDKATPMPLGNRAKGWTR